MASEVSSLVLGGGVAGAAPQVSSCVEGVAAGVVEGAGVVGLSPTTPGVPVAPVVPSRLLCGLRLGGGESTGSTGSTM